MRSMPRSISRLMPLLLLSALLLQVPAFAQPSDSVLKDFRPIGELMLEIDGNVVKDAEIYHSEGAVAYLLIAPQFSSPLMVSPRTRSVESVHLMKVYKKDDGTIDILADAELSTVGPFNVSGGEVTFNVDGRTAKLMPRPPLVGQHSPKGLAEYNPEYARKAGEYGPLDSAIAALRQNGKDVRVRVYFGTWCPVCSRLVPRILKVDEALADSTVHFEYYGLPQPMTDDPETERAGIHGVPTAVIFVDGKEAGRLTGGELNTPETAINKVLGSS